MDVRSTGEGRSCTRRLAAATAGLVGLAVLTVASRCLADDQQAFELAKNPFDAGQFAEAHARLSALLDPQLPACDPTSSATGRCRIAEPDLVERARSLDAASLLALKRDAEADAQIARILRQNPLYAPNPAMFPQEVIDRFTTVHGALRPELEAIAQSKARDELAKRVAAQKLHDAEEKWIAELQRLAGEERRVELNSRLIAMVPLGVGQFQNGDIRLGIAFAAGEALLGGTSLVTVAIVNKLASIHVSSGLVDTTKLNAQIRAAVIVNQITFATWGVLTVAGVIQAQVGFVPERTTLQKRLVPPRPTLAPMPIPFAAPVPGGAVVGLTGAF